MKTLLLVAAHGNAFFAWAACCLQSVCGQNIRQRPRSRGLDVFVGVLTTGTKLIIHSCGEDWQTLAAILRRLVFEFPDLSETKEMTIKIVLTGLLMATVACSAEAQLIVYSFNEDSPSATFNALAGSVTANDVVTPPYITPLNPDATTEVLMERYQRTLSDDARDSDGISELILTLNIGSSPVDLTRLDFTQGIDTRQGNNPTYSLVNLGITTTGSTTPMASRTMFSNQVLAADIELPIEIGYSETKESVMLSGLTGLTNTSVTFTFGVEYGTMPDGSGGDNLFRWAFLDDISFFGEGPGGIRELAQYGLPSSGVDTTDRASSDTEPNTVAGVLNGGSDVLGENGGIFLEGDDFAEFSAADAFAAGDYLDFTISLGNATSMDLSALNFNIDRTNDSVFQYAIRTSADGFASDIAVASFSTVGSNFVSVPLDDQANLQGLTEDLEIRIALFDGILGVDDNDAIIESLTVIGSVEATLEGDYNGDGVVDAADYTLWRDNLNDADESAINFNGDGGGVTQSDYAFWAARYGNGASVAQGAAVPEPTCAMLMLAAASGWWIAPRRKSSR